MEPLRVLIVVVGGVVREVRMGPGVNAAVMIADFDNEPDLEIPPPFRDLPAASGSGDLSLSEGIALYVAAGTRKRRGAAK